MVVTFPSLMRVTKYPSGTFSTYNFYSPYAL